MLIVCKTCASSYHIPRDILGENGCTLRCVGCGETWTVGPEAFDRDGAPVAESVDASYPSPRLAGGLHGAPAPRGRVPRARPLAFLAGKARSALVVLTTMGVIAGAMGALSARAAIVEAAPATARIFAAIGLPVNLRGLALDNARTSTFDLGDRKMLVVEGDIVNLRDGDVAAPKMRFALRGADKRELYVWTAPAPKAMLAAKERVAFRTRLAAPPDGVRDVLVRFAGADDASPMKEGL